MGFRALTLFAVFLIAAALFTIAVGSSLLGLYSPDPRIVSEMTKSVSVPENLRPAVSDASLSG